MENNSNIFEEPFEFPERVLDSISECSPEGFLLFIINDSGDVEFFCKPMADVVDAGLRVKAAKILSGLSAIEDNEIASQLFHQQVGDQAPPPRSDEDEEDEEIEDEEGGTL